MRRIVKNELLKTLSVNRNLMKVNNTLQTNIAVQQLATQKEICNEKNVDQFAYPENQYTAVFLTEIDDVEPISHIEMLDNEIDFQLHKCNVIVNNEVLSTTKEFVLDAMKQWILKYRYLLNQRVINDMLQILRVPYPKFPSDSRILLKTSNSCPYEIIRVPPDFYCHIDIENTTRRLINNGINM